MNSWELFRGVLRKALMRLYRGEHAAEIREGFLENNVLTCELSQHAKTELCEATSTYGSLPLRDDADVQFSALRVKTKPYKNANKEDKIVTAGGESRHRKPSFIFHVPESDKYNSLALFVKSEWKTPRGDIYGNYWNAIAFLSEELDYPLALCLELSKHRSMSKAYLASQQLKSMVGVERVHKMAKRLMVLANENLAAIHQPEVNCIRDELFDDVSSELFLGWDDSI